ncbi:MAG: NAD-dependent epimerase/dehydratase family protein, partial [Desulfovibrionaceae bacterium]|nr:NAD-dependent epimerase/dehydratase family protein [Desulfovibrionaceae bacterium]
AGFIGSVLVEALGRAGCSVTPLTRRECDMLDAGAVERTLAAIEPGGSAVLCACISRTQRDGFEVFQDNVAMVENFARLARPGQFQSVVYLSSTDVYGNSPTCPVSEKTLPAPDGYYGLAKYVCERILANSAAVDCPVSSLRLPGIFGPTDNGRSILGMFARKIAAGDTVRIFGDGGTLRDFVFVDDLCAIVAALLKRPHNGVLNIATGASRRLIDILNLLAKRLNCELRLKMEPPGERSNDLVFDLTKLRRVVGPLDLTPIEDGLDRLVNFLKN